ncbi:MAG: zinc metalloprotease HtpX [Phycisphaerae bacterium]|nr:zinc metalloprotease HtpX [Phycisphaerae bacterium]
MLQSLWNNTKTTLLLGGLMGLCLGVGYLLGGREAIVPALAIGAVLNVGAFFFSDRIALATMRAREVSRDEDPELYDTVAELAKRANLPLPRVCISPAAAPNAFATGRGPKHSAVCVTAGLRQMLSREELAGVIAHELSHVRHRDVLISTIAAVVAGAITMLTYFGLFFGGGDDDEGNPLIALAMLILAPIAAGLIRMAISRSREFEADRAGAEIAGSPRGLASALRKLHAGSQRVPLPAPDAQSGLFIVQPLSARARRGASKLFMTHPPVEQRIARLRAMER